MKKSKVWIVCLLCLSFLLTGCGDDGQQMMGTTKEKNEAEKAQLNTTMQDSENNTATDVVQKKEEALLTEKKEIAVLTEEQKQAVEASEEEGQGQFGEDTVSDLAEIEEETLGNPRSSYGLGSAPFLKGKNILVSMFVTTPESTWSEVEKQTTLGKIEIVADYIENQAANYGIETQLIYDFTKYSELEAEAITDFCINEETDFIDRLDEEIALWFEKIIDYEELLEQFNADGIATMVFVNNPGISYAIVYDGTDNVKESLVLFAQDYYNGGKAELPVTYAHEILHIFGAHDLYEEAEFTEEVTDYVTETYPKEIMLTVTGSGNTYSSIGGYISPITAYHLGWTDENEEIQLFPQLNRK